MKPKVKIGVALIIIGIGAIVFLYYKQKKSTSIPYNNNPNTYTSSQWEADYRAHGQKANINTDTLISLRQAINNKQYTL